MAACVLSPSSAFTAKVSELHRETTVGLVADPSQPQFWQGKGRETSWVDVDPCDGLRCFRVKPRAALRDRGRWGAFVLFSRPERQGQVASLLASLVVVGALCAPTSTFAGGRHGHHHNKGWQSAKLPAGIGALYSVACVPGSKSFSDCYAVGQTTPSGSGSTYAVVLRGNASGSRWSSMQVPVTYASTGAINYAHSFRGVACAAAGDCAAIGSVTTCTTDGACDAFELPRSDEEATGGVAFLNSPSNCEGCWSPIALQGWPSDVRHISCLAGKGCMVVTPSSLGVFCLCENGLTTQELGKPATPGIGYQPEAVAWPASGAAYVVGGSGCGGQGATECPGAIWGSTNGGSSWPLQFTHGPYNDAISCAASNRCWVAASTFSTGVVRRTTDGGKSWPKQNLPEFNGELNEISCVNGFSGGLCVTVGDGHHGHRGLILATRDGGDSWNRQHLPQAAGALIGVAALPGGKGVAVGLSPNQQAARLLYTTRAGG